MNNNFGVKSKPIKQGETIDRSRTHDDRNSEIFHLDDSNNAIKADDEYTTMTMYK